MATDRFHASGGFLLMLAALLLCLPMPWFVAAAIAALVHEGGHYLAICLISGKRSTACFSAFTARMPLPEMSRGAELVCALAGPAAGLLLLPLVRWLPRTAVCALGQSIFNLLPIYPFDGGRAFQCMSAMFLSPPRAALVSRIVEHIFRIAVLAAALFAAFRFDLGFFPILAAGIVVFPRK